MLEILTPAQLYEIAESDMSRALLLVPCLNTVGLNEVAKRTDVPELAGAARAEIADRKLD